MIGKSLHGARVASPDIRAGMAMLIAALCAEGESKSRMWIRSIRVHPDR